ncbi:hypothetical protein HK405_003795 [Cladochytrium tenue]|nr:hypothetical protein HK405_003795 [Cladochytrium tenue]
MPPKPHVQSTQARAAAVTSPYVTVSTAAAATTSAAAAPSPTRPYATVTIGQLQPRSSLDSYLAAAGLAPFGRRQRRRSGSIQVNASGAAAAAAATANASSGARSPLHPRVPILQQHRQHKQHQQQQQPQHQQQQSQQQQSGMMLLPLFDTEAERRTARDAEIAYALQNYELAAAAPGGDGGRASPGPGSLLAGGFAGVRGANGLAAWPDDAASILLHQQRRSESPAKACGPIVVQPLLAAKPLPAGFRTIRDLSAGVDDDGADGGAGVASRLSTLLRGRLRSQQVRRERLAPLQVHQRQRSNGGQVLPELPWVKRHAAANLPRPSSAPPPTTRRQPPLSASADMAVDVTAFPLAAAADVLVYPSAAVRRAPVSPVPLPEFVVTSTQQQTPAAATRTMAAAGTTTATRLADQHRSRVARLVTEAGRVPVAVTTASDVQQQQHQQYYTPLPSPPAPPKGPRSPRVFAPPVVATVARRAASPPSPASSPSDTPVALPAPPARAVPWNGVTAAAPAPSAAAVGRIAPPTQPLVPPRRWVVPPPGARAQG